MRLTATIVLVVMALTGCANSAEIQALQNQINATIPTCNANIENQCERMWETAQVWITRNSAYKMQIATEVILETFNPAEYDTGIAVRVVKEPTSNTSYRFLVTVWFANIFGCNPNQYQAALDFNKTLNNTKI